MRSYYAFRFKNLMLIGIGLSLFIACGTYQNTSYYDTDGVYETEEKPAKRAEKVYVKETKTQPKSNKYTEQFKAMRINTNDNEYITDVDAYSSDSVRVDTVYVERQQYAAWGNNSTDDVTINVYHNGWGYNNWNYRPWNGWYHPNHWGLNVSFGWGNYYNYYGPSWGWNDWYYPYYGGYYGYYGYNYPYYGGYYGYPYYYGGYYYGRNNVAYNNGVRGGRRESAIGTGSRMSYSQNNGGRSYENPRNANENPRNSANPRSENNPRGYENPRGAVVTPRNETNNTRGYENPRGVNVESPQHEPTYNTSRPTNTPRSVTPTSSNDYPRSTPSRSYDSPRSSNSSPSYTPSRSYDSPRSSTSNSSGSTSGSSNGGRGGRR